MMNNPYNQAPPLQLDPMPNFQQLMQRSQTLKTCSIIGLVLIVVLMILPILISNVDCSDYHPCTYYYSNNPIECQTFYSYCCQSGYSYCGDYQYCNLKPYESDICWGLYYAFWIGCGILLVIIFTIIVTIFQLRRKIRGELINRNMYFVQQHRPVFVQPQQGYPQVYVPQGPPPQGYIPPGQLRPQANNPINGPINHQGIQNGGLNEYRRI